jgi:hypothetical protein
MPATLIERGLLDHALASPLGALEPDDIGVLMGLANSVL